MTPPNAEPQLNICSGGDLSDAQRRVAVDIVYEAFRDKLHNLLLITDSAAQVKRILPEAIDFSCSLVALVENEVCGVLLMNEGAGDFLCYDWALVRREFGWWGAVYRIANFRIVTHRKHRPGELNIQALAVCAERRSQGIGARLLDAAEAYGRDNDCRFLSLDVIDTNPRARELYLRRGFVKKKTSSTWPFTRRAGFRTYDSMEKPIEGSEVRC